MKIFESIKAYLTENAVPYETMEHEETPTSEDSARVRGDELKQGAKAIVYKIEKEYYLFVMSAIHRMDTKLIKNEFKHRGYKAKKTRFASAEELMELTGLVPGSVPPFGEPVLPFKLYVDPKLMDNETISFNAGSLRHSIRMNASDYEKHCNGEFFEFAQ